MPQSLRTLSITCVVVVVCGGLLFLARPAAESTASADALRAGDGLTWYKGNLHTHSLWSDGDDYLEMIGLWYKERDYDFLCFTDHNILPDGERWTDVERNKGGRRAYEKLTERFPDWVDERTVDGRLQVRLRTFDEVSEKLGEPGDFLLLKGEEITDRFGNLPVHLNATNLQQFLPPLGGESVYEVMQNNVNAVIAQRERTGEPILVHLNHPNFGWAVTAEDLMRVRGENFFEVYNGHPGVNNSGDERRASTERMWDVILTRRLAELRMPVMYGLATDDGHNYHDIPSRASEPGRGWVMVLAAELTPAALIDALERGRFYASSGVTLESVVASAEGLEVAVRGEPEVEYVIEFIGTRRGYDPTSEPVLDAQGNPVHTTRRYSDEVGEIFQRIEGTQAAYRFTEDDLYVRATVTSSKRHPNPSEVGEYECAWAQPVRGPAAPPED